MNDSIVDQNKQLNVDALTISKIDEEHPSFFALKVLSMQFSLRATLRFEHFQNLHATAKN